MRYTAILASEKVLKGVQKSIIGKAVLAEKRGEAVVSWDAPAFERNAKAKRIRELKEAYEEPLKKSK